jgi:hypothetical protein
LSYPLASARGSKLYHLAASSQVLVLHRSIQKPIASNSTGKQPSPASPEVSLASHWRIVICSSNDHCAVAATGAPTPVARIRPKLWPQQGFLSVRGRHAESGASLRARPYSPNRPG